jgi:hypothetical protein
MSYAKSKDDAALRCAEVRAAYDKLIEEAEHA